MRGGLLALAGLRVQPRVLTFMGSPSRLRYQWEPQGKTLFWWFDFLGDGNYAEAVAQSRFSRGPHELFF